MRVLPLPGRSAAVALGAVAALLAALVWLAPPVAAHDQLVSSTPADGEVLTELPAQIVLEFSNTLIDAAPAVLIRDASDTTVFRAIPLVDDRTATAVFPDLGDGAYRLAWSVVSSDGHRIEGSMPFELATGRAVAGVTTATGGSTAGSAAGSAAAASTGATPTSSPAEPAGVSLSTTAKVGIGVAALGAVAAIVVLAVRRQRDGSLGQ